MNDFDDIPMTPMQELLNEEARLSNDLYNIRVKIRSERTEALRPACFGEDDCSTWRLVQCPWRFDCGS